MSTAQPNRNHRSRSIAYDRHHRDHRIANRIEQTDRRPQIRTHLDHAHRRTS